MNVTLLSNIHRWSALAMNGFRDPVLIKWTFLNLSLNGIFSSLYPWCAGIREVALSSCSPVMITGILTNHSSLPDSEGQLQMFCLAFSNSKKPVQAIFFFLFLPCQAARTQPAISDCQMSPLYSSVYLCSSSFCLLWPFSTKQWSSGWRQLAYASPRSITRAQTSPALWCNDARLEGTKVSYAATRRSDSTRGWRTTCLLESREGHHKGQQVAAGKQACIFLNNPHPLTRES